MDSSAGPASSPPQRPHLSWRFVAGYGAAQAGTFIAFIPLLTLLLPLKAEALAGDGKALLLSQIAMAGGLTAAAANYLVGALSDATPGRLGRRRPWIAFGALATGLMLILIHLAPDALTLGLAIVGFQLAVNAVYAPLLALVPDMAPDRQKGLISAIAGLALPTANLFTAGLAAWLVGRGGAPFLATAIVAAALILPLALSVREPARAGPAPRVKLSFRALIDGDFRLAFLARLASESAVAIHTLFLLFFIQGLPAAVLLTAWSAAGLFGALLVVSTISAAAAGLAGGIASDRLRRRRTFVIAGCLGMAGALAAFVALPTLTGLIAAQVLFGIGHGLHAAVVAAMNAEILPEPEQAGRDLGLMNIAIALPQTLAPAGAALLLGLGLKLPAVFAAAAGLAVLAALLLAAMRRKAEAGA